MPFPARLLHDQPEDDRTENRAEEGADDPLPKMVRKEDREVPEGDAHDEEDDEGHGLPAPPVLAARLAAGAALGVAFAPFGRVIVAVTTAVGQGTGAVPGTVIGPLDRRHRSRRRLGGRLLDAGRGARSFALVVSTEFRHLDVVGIGGHPAALDFGDPQAPADETWLALLPGGQN